MSLDSDNYEDTIKFNNKEKVKETEKITKAKNSKCR